MSYLFGLHYILCLKTAQKRKQRIKTTQLHIQTYQTYLTGQPRLFPGGGESYEIFIDEAASIVAENMKIAKYCPGGWDRYKFRNIFNIDRGTLANPETIRNAMVYKIKEKLGIPQKVTYWSNPQTGIFYNFREYHVIVSQELFHLVIRCRESKVWNYKHSDTTCIIRAFTAVTKGLQYKYDISTSPPYLSDKLFDPKTLIKKCVFLTQ